MKTKKSKWEPIDLLIIRKHFVNTNWCELLDIVNEARPASQQIIMSNLRTQCKRMGLAKRNIQIRWSKQDIDFLCKNYRKIGNVELAELLTKRRKTYRIENGKKTYRTFTKKHVEKKIKLLVLPARTQQEILAIKRRNLTTTNYKVLTHDDNLWTRGVLQAANEEDVRIWKGRRYVKVNGKFTPYARWFYHNFVEKIPKGYIVYHLDADTLNDDPDNLVMVKRTGLHSRERLCKSIQLLCLREQKIEQVLPTMNYDRQKQVIRGMHTDLNRIRGLKSKINSKLNNQY